MADGRKVAVVSGAGPVGAVAACLLAAQGWTVKVFEKRELPPVRPGPDNSQAYMLSLSTRGLKACEAAGTDLRSLAKPANGKTEFIVYGNRSQVVMKFESVVDPQEPSIIMLYREELSNHLVQETQRLHPQAVSFTFQAGVTSVDFDQQTVFISRAGHADEKVRYDVLVGADGAGSVVRQQLQQSLPSSFCRRFQHGAVFSSCMVSDDGSPDSSGRRHTFNERHSFPRGAILYGDRGDGHRRVTLGLTDAEAAKVRQGNVADVLRHLDDPKCLIKLDPAARAAARRLLQSKPAFHSLASWTYLSQLHGPKTVLLGDASHTVSPVLGQGVNCGLEDALTFAQVLQQHPGSLDAALEQYTQQRLPDVLALVSINQAVSGVRGIIQKGDVRALLWSLSFWAANAYNMMTHKVLHAIAPATFQGPILMRMAQGKVPYRAVLSTLQQDLYFLGAGLAGGLALYALRR